MGNKSVSPIMIHFTAELRMIGAVSGSSELDEPIAIRPTSETVMYPCKSLRSAVCAPAKE